MAQESRYSLAGTCISKSRIRLTSSCQPGAVIISQLDWETWTPDSLTWYSFSLRVLKSWGLQFLANCQQEASLSSLPYGILYTEVYNTVACFFRVSKQVEVERVRANKRESTALCNIALTVTSYHFCCALSTRSKAGGPVPTKGRDCKKMWTSGITGVSSEVSLPLSLMLLRKQLLDLFLLVLHIFRLPYLPSLFLLLFLLIYHHALQNGKKNAYW